MRLAALLGLLAAVGAAQAGGLLAPVGSLLQAAGTQGVVAGLAGQDINALISYDCGGTAPLTTACGPLEFQAAAGATYRLFTNAGTGSTGTVVAVLSDAYGHWHSFACTYFVYVGGVTPGPSCSENKNGELNAGTLALTGWVTSSNGGLAAGYWEVGATLQ